MNYSTSRAAAYDTDLLQALRLFGSGFALHFPIAVAHSSRQDVVLGCTVRDKGGVCTGARIAPILGTANLQRAFGQYSPRKLWLAHI